MIREIGNNAENWQKEWDQITKGEITKEYFQVVAGRLNMRIKITHNFKSNETGHCNRSSYLHRIKIIDSPKCPCGTNYQILYRLLFECELLNKERDSLILTALKTPIGIEVKI